MARSYSVDLREKVISYIMGGSSKREAARMFNIGEDTIYRWLRLHKAGDLRPKKRISYPRKMDEEKLKEYVKDHPDHTITEIASALKLGRQTVFSWLRRLNITRKKRPRFTGNAVRKSAINLKDS